MIRNFKSLFSLEAKKIITHLQAKLGETVKEDWADMVITTTTYLGVIIIMHANLIFGPHRMYVYGAQER